LFAATPAFSQPWGWGRGGRWGDGGYGAATVGESRANGLSNIITARSQANLTNSEAAQNYEAVRSAQLDNRVKTASTYFDMRRMNTTERFGTPEEKAAHKAANQEKYYEWARSGRPDRPSSQQLDPITGKINWPFSLMPDKYAPYRDELNELFAKRAQHGGYLTYTEYTQLEKTTDAMYASLKEEIKELNSMDYINAKNFIQALMHEARQSNT
jgi:hypothetical protein